MNDKQSFFEDVWEVAKLVPQGRVTTYGAIAKYLGLKSSARMVGWALNGSAIDKNVPAHRVVNRQGLLTGRVHFSTPTRMQELLEQEGIVVKDDKIVDFKGAFWDPSEHLF